MHKTEHKRYDVAISIWDIVGLCVLASTTTHLCSIRNERFTLYYYFHVENRYNIVISDLQLSHGKHG